MGNFGKKRTPHRSFFGHKYVESRRWRAASTRQEIHALVLALTRGFESKEELKWRWSDEKATLAYSVKQHLQDYEVELVNEKEYYTPINIRNTKDRTTIYSDLRSHRSTIFTRWKETLYLADFCPISSGCNVIALDLKTGKTLWKSRLFGIVWSPSPHSKYSNHVILHALNNGTFSNVWNFGVSKVASAALCLVDNSLRHWSMRA